MTGNTEIKEQREGKRVLALFLQFLKFGCFTFGGGMSIVSQIHGVYVEEKGYISNEELLDIISISRSLPGTMIGNAAMLFGYRTAGISGGMACSLGMILPPFLILILVTTCYNAIETNPWAIAAMTGIRASIVPIIVSAMIKMLKGAFRYPVCYLITLACAVLYLFCNFSAFWLIIVGVISGLVISEAYERLESRTE